MNPHQLELTELRRDWVEDAMPRVVAMLPSLGEFTSDDLHPLLPPPECNNHFGVLLAKLKNMGLVRCIGYKASLRPERNGGVLRLWKAV